VLQQLWHNTPTVGATTTMTQHPHSWCYNNYDTTHPQLVLQQLWHNTPTVGATTTVTQHNHRRCYNNCDTTHPQLVPQQRYYLIVPSHFGPGPFVPVVVPVAVPPPYGRTEADAILELPWVLPPTSWIKSQGAIREDNSWCIWCIFRIYGVLY